MNNFSPEAIAVQRKIKKEQIIFNNTTILLICV